MFYITYLQKEIDMTRPADGLDNLSSNKKNNQGPRIVWKLWRGVENSALKQAVQF